MFKLILVDTNKKLVQAWKKSFQEYKSSPGIDIFHSKFEDVDSNDYECLVSPANSFGIMDGGIDKAIIDYFGQQLMDRIQQGIINAYGGEQPVGTSILISLSEGGFLSGIPFLAHTPTMRTPKSIIDTSNVYYAMKAVLEVVNNFNKVFDKPEDANFNIKTVLCPGLGTLSGRVPVDIAAEQMALAYNHFMNPPEKINWNFALDRENEISKYEKDSNITDQQEKFPISDSDRQESKA